MLILYNFCMMEYRVQFAYSRQVFYFEINRLVNIEKCTGCLRNLRRPIPTLANKTLAFIISP